MAESYQLKPSQLNELAKRMNAWCGREGGVDREGLFSFSTCNPDGRWDWYTIGGRWNGYIPYSRTNTITSGTLAKASYLGKCLPYQILTPEGEWIEYERYYMLSNPNDIKHEQMEKEQWLITVRETLNKWPKHTVVCVDIHC